MITIWTTNVLLSQFPFPLPSFAQSLLSAAMSYIPDLLSGDSFHPQPTLTLTSSSSSSSTTAITATTTATTALTNVTVDVCGSRFCITPTLFQRVKQLDFYDHLGIPHLHANPDVFEILLQYFLFESLPDVSTLHPHELTELETLAIQLSNNNNINTNNNTNNHNNNTHDNNTNNNTVELLMGHILQAKKYKKSSSGSNSRSMTMTMTMTTSFLRRRRQCYSSLTGKSRKKQRRCTHTEDRDHQEEEEEADEIEYQFAAKPTPVKNNQAVHADDYYFAPPLEPTVSTDTEDLSSSYRDDDNDDDDDDDDDNNKKVGDGTTTAAAAATSSSANPFSETKKKTLILPSKMMTTSTHGTIHAPKIVKNLVKHIPRPLRKTKTHEQWCASEYVL